MITRCVICAIISRKTDLYQHRAPLVGRCFLAVSSNFNMLIPSPARMFLLIVMILVDLAQW